MVKLFTYFLLAMTMLYGEVVVNEYSAANLTGYLDNYDYGEDWIELYNTGTSQIDLTGYYLSDNPDEPMKWQIPSGITISGEGYKTFWCSGRDEVSSGHAHTNFKLKQTKATPEHIVFSDPDGNIINDIQIQITQLEHSMGRSSNAAEDWKIFTSPTKGNRNTGLKFSAYTAPPVMSEEAGFHDGAITLEITTEEPDANIYYTTNGNVPTSNTILYTGPINISSTKIIKAIVISPEMDILNSFVTFNTYFIDEEHTLPIISAAANQFTTLLNGNQSLRPHGTIEYFDANGIRKDFGYGEYNKHGQDSWAFPQRSFDYIARDEMGYHDAVHEKLLSLTDRDAFQRLVIRASGDDNYPGIDSSAHTRDVFIQKLANKYDLNVDMRRGDRCVVYANGQFWGIYSIREKVSDSDYTNYYYGQDKYNIQYVMNWGSTWAQYGGSAAISAWNSIKNYTLSNDLSVQSNYDYVASQIDVTSLVDYVLINSFVVCTDWINWNTSVWRGLDPNGSHLKWGFVLWDEDATFNHYINYTNVPDESPQADPCYPEGIYWDPLGVIDILNKLRESDEFNQYYHTRYMDLLNTVFREDVMIPLLEEIENAIAPEMPQHIARWGGNYNEWSSNVRKIKDFIRARIAHFPQGLNECYNLHGPYEITLEVEPAYSGQIDLNSLSLESDDFPWTGNYHGGVDILLNASQTTIFDHWILENHSVSDPYAPSISLMLNEGDVITAVHEPVETTSIVINEINYHSADDFNAEDWVELFNPMNEDISVGNWIFKDDNDEHEFILPENLELAAGEYLVLCRDTSLFKAHFPQVNNYWGNFDFGLSGGGELLRLYDAEGALVDTVQYNDVDPWPSAPDGNGPTLELIDPFADNAFAGTWASSEGNGTPGSFNSVIQIAGDINGDGVVNVADVISLVNVVLTNDYTADADMNGDSIVDVIDIIQLVNLILGNARAEDATIATLLQEEQSISVSADGYIGAVQMTLSHEPGFNFKLTHSALVSDYNTSANLTTIIVVAPADEKLLTTEDSFEIDDIVVTNSTEAIQVMKPIAFSLNPAYPNPFNAATNIDFSIPMDGYVNIKVYDIAGREMASLADKEFNSGYHSIIWNADRFASGVYFLKFAAMDYTQTQKLILLK